MPLLYCPECGHEVSASAVACPNCGHPMNPAAEPVEPVARKKVVVTPPVRRESSFPPWAIVPIGIGALLLVFFAYLMLRSPDDGANTNVNVNMSGRRTADSRTPTMPSTSTDIPSSDTTVAMPGTSDSVPSTSTTIPGATTGVSLPPEKGIVKITARITTTRSGTQPIRGTKFYLLDKDLESILSEANVEPIEGNTLAGSMGLAIVFPDRYGDFQRNAMRAIARHVKYTGTTDSSGNASVSGVDPQQYYLFGITRVGRGFAMWDAPVSIIPGENILNLSPQSVTEIPDTSG